MVKRESPGSAGGLALQPVKRSRLNEQKPLTARSRAPQQDSKPPNHLELLPGALTLAPPRPPQDELALSVARYLYHHNCALPSGQFTTADNIEKLICNPQSKFRDLCIGLWSLGLAVKPRPLMQHLGADFPRHLWPPGHHVLNIEQEFNVGPSLAPAQALNVAMKPEAKKSAELLPPRAPITRLDADLGVKYPHTAPPQHLPQISLPPSAIPSTRPRHDLLAQSIVQYLYYIRYPLPSGKFLTEKDILDFYNPVWTTFVDLHRILWCYGIHLKPLVLAQHLWASFPGFNWPVVHDVPNLARDSDAMAPPSRALDNGAIKSEPSQTAALQSQTPINQAVTPHVQPPDVFASNTQHQYPARSSPTRRLETREGSRGSQESRPLLEDLDSKHPHTAHALREFERKSASSAEVKPQQQTRYKAVRQSVPVNWSGAGTNSQQNQATMDTHSKAAVTRRRQTELVRKLATPDAPSSSQIATAEIHDGSRIKSEYKSILEPGSDHPAGALRRSRLSKPPAFNVHADSSTHSDSTSAPLSSSPSSSLMKSETSSTKATTTVKSERRSDISAKVDSQTRPTSIGEEEPKLCAEQDALVKLIMAGSNVFYTGSAGCGKSTVLKAFVSRMKREGKTVYILAPTGKAALGVGGSTTWSYAGWTPDSMKKPMDELKTAAHAKKVRQRMKSTHALVFDEVSMVENHHFERLNQVMQENRGNGRPFGGVQVIATGDFCQLPPVKPFQYCIHCGRTMAVVDGGLGYKCPQHGIFKDEDKWAFRSNAWKQCRFEHRNLTTIHRQSDKIFIDILNKYRYGVTLTDEDEHLLLEHDSITTHAVKLFPTRQEVATLNNAEFLKLRSKPRKFVTHDDFKWNPVHQNLRLKAQRDPNDNSLEALREHRYEASVELKQGMLVVLLQNLNLDAGLCNGSQGVIVGFKKHEESDIIKSTRSLGEGIPYESLKEANLRAFVEAAPEKVWPIVLFTNGIKCPIIADCSMNELGDEKPYSLISRTQIPLMAAWAMTVHKSQGMTLDRVIVNLANSFEEGQVYVALSRARNLEGLKVECLGLHQGKANPQVMQFLTEKFGSYG